MFDRSTLALAAGRGVPLGALPATLAERFGDRPAVTDDAATPGLHDGGTRTHVEIAEHTARLAAAHVALLSAVLERDLAGAHVLVAVGNRIDTFLHVAALASVGAVPVLCNPRLTGGEAAAVATAAAGVAAVVDTDVAERFGSALDLPRVDTDQVAAWLVAHPDARLAPADDLDPDAVTLYAATSGTTGTPKAAALTSRGLLASLGRLALAPVGRQRGPRAGRDRILAALPLTHIMGFQVLVGALCAGVELLHRPRFDAGEVLDLIERERPNVVIGVPTMYADLEAAGVDERDCTSVQLWGSSADAMPADRARRFQRRGRLAAPRGRGVGTAAFVDIYGMVELSGAGAVRVYPPSFLPGVELPAVAVVLPGIEARVVDEERTELGWGQPGELEFRGPGVLQRYEGRDDAGPDGDGWFATGDHGRLYPGGVFAFAGRRRDRIKVGGFSVFPAEVEETLVGAPGVAEVALVGVPDERLGERPVALVVPTSAGAVDPDEVLDWAGAHVAGYRRPTAVLVVDAIPRGNNDKVARGEATELAARLLAGGEA